MDLVKEAIFLGFSGAAVMDTTQLVFVPEYRMFCEENLCGCYNVNPACPPESGTVEEMKQRALQYEKTLVLQTMQEDTHDPTQYKKDKLLQNKMTEELAEKMKEAGKTDILIMGAGPYKHNSCMSAYCVDAQKMAEAAGMLCWTDDGMVRYFSQILPSCLAVCSLTANENSFLSGQYAIYRSACSTLCDTEKYVPPTRLRQLSQIKAPFSSKNDQLPHSVSPHAPQPFSSG